MSWFTQTLMAMACLALLVAGGCFDRTYRMDPPSFSPKRATNIAFQQHDADGDGVLSKQELQGIPGVLHRISNWDNDESGTVSRKEFREKIAQWKADGAAIARFRCRVTFNGRPLEEATVELIPEDCVADTITAVSGKTVKGGIAELSLPRESLPSRLPASVRGVMPGLYKVKITHPQKHLPARYNESTELGWEVALGYNPMEEIVFDLEGE